MTKLFRVYFESVAFVDVQADNEAEAEELAMQVDPADYTVNGWSMTDETIDVEAEKQKEDEELERMKENARKYRAEHPDEFKGE